MPHISICILWLNSPADGAALELARDIILKIVRNHFDASLGYALSKYRSMAHSQDGLNYYVERNLKTGGQQQHSFLNRVRGSPNSVERMPVKKLLKTLKLISLRDLRCPSLL